MIKKLFEKYLRKIKNLKSFMVMIIPDHTGAESRSRKLTLTKIATYLAIYTVIIFFLGFFLISLSPFNKYLLPTTLSSEDMKQVQQLNERVYFLAKELESLKSTNEKLRYAIVLGDSTMIDSLKQNNKTRNDSVVPAEGNILKIFKGFLNKSENTIKQDNIYFIKPSEGYISNGFNPVKGHMGIDFVLKSGSPVYASASGYVVFAEYTLSTGYTIIINHSFQYVTIYKHCSSLLKKERDTVSQGEMIALSGNTGENTSGPHLHFEMWKDGKPLNPEKIFLNY